MKGARIHPAHSSMPRNTPVGFGTYGISHEQKNLLQCLTNEIFTDMANQGHSFQDCLLAVMASGIHFALSTASGPTP